jgi:hypothetical protein
MGKGYRIPLLTRSLVDPAVASRKPRPKDVAASPVATFLLIEVTRHLEGRWEGTETAKQALLPPF